MSTISSTTDLSTKYHRVATEYAKLKAQIPVLKTAVIGEQAKTKRLTDEIHAKESALRKLESENESLTFRNSQLLKRVEALQLEIDRAIHSGPSGKKRSSAVQQQTSSQFELSKIDSSLLENELLVKVRENERLHTKIFELESVREKDVAALNEKCVFLQKENDHLKALVEEHLNAGNTTTNSSSSNNETTNPSQSNECSCSELENPKASVSGENRLLENIEETNHALVVDALRSSHILLSSFAALLRLLEQRSTIYPNDTTFEVLPETTKQYGAYLVRSVDLVDNITINLDELIHQATDDQSVNIIEQCHQMLPSIIEAFNSTTVWKELFADGVERENRQSWAGVNLCKLNNEWRRVFLKFLQSLFDIAEQLNDIANQNINSFIKPLENLHSIISECLRIFTDKIFDENRIPTASKRLRCVNECIEKCLGSLAKNISNLNALLIVINGTTVSTASTIPATAAAANTASSTSSTSHTMGDHKPLSSDDRQHQRSLSNIDENQSTSTSQYSQQKLSNQNESEELQQQQEQQQQQFDAISSHTVSSDSITPIPRSSPSLSSLNNSLKIELDSATSRVLELEKEKERIMIETELLKMKFASLSSSDSDETKAKINGDELELLGVYFEKRVGELLAQLQFANSRAIYYKTECEQLLRKTLNVMKEKDALKTNLDECQVQIARLNDDLEITRKGYEDQMRSLYEHLGELNWKIENQTDTITTLRETSKRSSNGIAKQGSRRLLFK